LLYVPLYRLRTWPYLTNNFFCCNFEDQDSKNTANSYLNIQFLIKLSFKSHAQLTICWIIYWMPQCTRFFKEFECSYTFCNSQSWHKMLSQVHQHWCWVLQVWLPQIGESSHRCTFYNSVICWPTHVDYVCFVYVVIVIKLWHFLYEKL